jgi:hypothetical protein
LDNKRAPNPLVQPNDQVLKSIAYMGADPNFKTFTEWIAACHASMRKLVPTVRDEIDLRWAQGQCQALLLISKALTQAHEELEKRMLEREKDRLQRNP